MLHPQGPYVRDNIVNYTLAHGPEYHSLVAADDDDIIKYLFEHGMVSENLDFRFELMRTLNNVVDFSDRLAIYIESNFENNVIVAALESLRRGNLN